MKKYKVLFFLLSLVFLTNIFMGCATPGREYEMYKFKKTAKTDALKHVEEKYGFTPKIVKTECRIKRNHPIDILGTPTGDVIVSMKYNEKEFTVYTDALTEGDYCTDNYQYEEIEQAIKNKVVEEAGSDLAYYKISYGIRWSHNYDYLGLINEYYDGTNLDEILSKQSIEAIFKFVNLDSLDNLDNLKSINKESDNVMFVNFNNEEDMNNAEESTYLSDGDKESQVIYEDAMLIKSAKMFKNNKIKNINAKESNGVYYILPDSNEDVTIKTSPPKDISHWEKAKLGTKFDKEKDVFITESYSIDYKGDIYIFYPVEELSKKNTIRFVVKDFISDKNEKYEKENVKLNGKYFCFLVHGKLYDKYSFQIIGQKNN